MNKHKSLMVALTLTGLLSACTNDDDRLSGPNPVGKPGSITFSFPGTAKGAVPYAGELASAEENEIKTLDIYVFGQDTLYDGTPGSNMHLEEIFRFGEGGAAISDNAGAKSVTLSVQGMNKKQFYFVANARGETSFGSSLLNDVELQKTDTAAFRKKNTEAMTGFLACPLLMTAEDSIPDMPAFAATPDAREVTLIRRVARFDISNRVDDSNFKIEWIQLQGVRTQGYIYPSAPAYASALKDDLPRIDFRAMANANYGDSPSVFYLYPSDDPKEITITLGGVSPGGQKILYPVLMKKNQSDADYLPAIKANNRYVINMKPLGTGYLDATLEVKEWIIGDTLTANAGYGSIELVKTDDATPLTNNILSVEAEAMAAEMEVGVKAITEWKVASHSDWINITAQPLAGEVGEMIKVQTTSANANGLAPRIGTVVLENVMRPSITQTLIVEQAANTKRYINMISSRIANNSIALSGSGEKISIEMAFGGDGTSDPTGYDVTIPGAATWLTAEESETALKSSYSKKYLVLTCAANSTDKADSTEIVIAATNDSEFKTTLKVVRAARPLGGINLPNVPKEADGTQLKTFENHSYNDQNADGTWKPFRVTVVAQSEWEAAVVESSETWLKVIDVQTPNTATGSYDGSFRLEVLANTTLSERAATVKVSNKATPDKIFKVFKVVQKAGEAQPIVLEVSSTTVNLAKDNGANETVTVTLQNDTENKGYTVDESIAWLDVADNDGTLTLTANEENTGLTARSGTITVKSVADENKTATITVKQAATPVTLSVDNAAVSISKDGQSIDHGTITVTTNDDNWTVSQTDGTSAWLKVEKTNASTLTISMESGQEDNSTGSERTSTITITSAADGTKTQTIVVTQAEV